MKKIRIVSFLLALLMLLGCMTLFAACGGKDGEVKVSRKSLTLDLSAFSLYYGDELSRGDAYREMMSDLSALLSKKTGKTITGRPFVNAPKETDGKEILIGTTTREESVDALDSIKGDGFAITVSEDKIAIIGTTKILTIQALQYFIINYLSANDSLTALSVPVEMRANKVESVVLATNEVCNYSFVYGADLNDTNKYTGGESAISGDGLDHRDYPYAAVEGLIEKASSLVGLREKKFVKNKDSEPAAQAEFAVGIVDREPVQQALAELNGGQYCFRVQNGQFILTAWNETSLKKGYDLVAAMLEDALVEGEGSKSLVFPEGFEMIGDGNAAWQIDFPKPDGLQLHNTLDTADNSLQYLYLGEGVNADAFRAYCEKLVGEGFTLLTENEIEESLFATYVNEQAGQMIYVAYNAYAHQEKYENRYEKALRIVVSPTDDVAVPDATILQAPSSYQKVTDTTVTAVAVPKGYVGMSYVITLEDGRFIIFDGGKVDESTVTTSELWNVLKEQYKRIYGREPTKSQPVRLAAWVITHSHSDHYNVPRKMMEIYGAEGLFTLEYLIGNYPSKSSVWSIYNVDIGKMTEGGAIKEMQRHVDFTFLKVHAGQKYYFANLEIEVLTTYDDMNPNRIRVQNDTNTVLRFCFKKPGKEDCVMLWLGDANRDQSRFMCAMYGDYLKADLVQLAHHGNTGCETDLYNEAGASVVMWPNTLDWYQKYMDPEKRKDSRRYDVDQTLIYDNVNTKYVFVADKLHVVIPLGEDNKMMLDKVYNALLGPDALIEYTTDVRNGGTAIKVRD